MVMTDHLTYSKQQGICAACGEPLDSEQTSSICWKCKVKSEVDILQSKVATAGGQIAALKLAIEEMQKRYERGSTSDQKEEKKDEEAKDTVVQETQGSGENADKHVS